MKTIIINKCFFLFLMSFLLFFQVYAVTDTFYPTDDAFCHENYPDDNWNGIYLYFGDWDGVSGSLGACVSLIKFDISSIPSNANITSAELKLYCQYNTGVDQFRIFEADPETPWNEETVTFNNMPYGTTENISGFYQNLNNGWNTVNVISYISFWQSGNTNNGFQIFVNSLIDGKFAIFNDKEHTSKPMLIIEYTVPPPDIFVDNPIVNPTTVCVGGTIDVSCNQCISNASSTTVYPNVGYYLSTNSTCTTTYDTYLGDDGSSLSSTDQCDPESETLTIPAGISPGTYYLCFIGDYLNEVNESDENNNCQHVQITVNAAPEVLDCSNSISLSCGEAYNGTTTDGNSNVSTYSCSSWNESGNEKVHTISVLNSGTLTASLSNLSTDLDIFILGSCDKNDCLAHGDNEATYEVSVGTYYIIVDGYQGANGSYTLTVTCPEEQYPDINVTPPSLTITQPDKFLNRNKKIDYVNEENHEYACGCIIPDSVIEYWKNHKPINYYLDKSKSSVDWSSNDSPVKSQGSCGSCWAFAATAYIENLGLQTDLSEQVVVSCTSGSCAGGYFRDALIYYRDHGVPDESCYPYIAEDGNCDDQCSNPMFLERINQVSYSLWGIATVDNIKAQLQNGPLVVHMKVPDDGTFSSYNGGIYNYDGDEIPSDRGHAVLLVGYDDNEQCFKVKNSWGTWWGEDGYFRIAYDDVTDDVQFGSYAVNGSGVYTQSISNSILLKNIGNATLTINSITDNQEWLSTSGYSNIPFDILSENSQSINIDIDWSQITDTDSAIVTVESNDPDEPSVTVKVIAIPNDPYLNISDCPNSNVSSNSGNFILDISSNISWSVSEDCDWVTVNPTSGSNDGSFTVSYEENTGTNERTCTITVSDESISDQCTFNQDYNCTTPGSPSANSPSDITQTGANFSWSAGNPVGSPTVTYYWAVGTSSSVTYESGYTDRGTTTGTTANTNALNCNNTYYFRVKACTNCDNTCSGYSSYKQFETDNCCTTPGTPSANNPTSITETGANFSWSSGSPTGSTTVTYKWAIGTSSNVTYESGYTDRGTTTGTTSNTNALNECTTYYFKLKACTDCDGTCSGYSSNKQFITEGCCTQPNATVNNVSNCNITCDVTGGSGGDIAYKWYNGTSCLGTVIGTNSTLQVNTDGYYACKAYINEYESTCYDCDYGYSNCSDAIDEISSIDSIKIYPNPATNTINIVFEDKSYKDVKVSLLNIQGQTISGIKQTTVNSNTLQLNLSNCSNGIYYLNIQTDKGTFVRKISVIK